MHRSAIPENQIPRVCAYLDNLAASVQKPLDFFLFETEPIRWAPFCDENVISLKSPL